MVKMATCPTVKPAGKVSLVVKSKAPNYKPQGFVVFEEATPLAFFPYGC